MLITKSKVNIKFNEINIDLTKIKSKIENSESDTTEIKNTLNTQTLKLNELEKSITILRSEQNGSKKTMTVFFALMPIMIAAFTYYSEYLSNKPSANEQKESLQLLWKYYNQDRLQINNLDKKISLISKN